VGFHDNPENTPGMLSKALELWAFRVSSLCKSIQAFAYCWQMALIMLGSIPIMIVANAIQMLVLLGATKNENEDLTMAQQIVTDSVMNARTVQALGVEKALVAMYVSWVDKSAKGMWCRNIAAGFGFGVSSGVMFFVMAGGFYAASLLIKDGSADFEGVMMAFMGVFYAGMGAGQAAVMVGDTAKARNTGLLGPGQKGRRETNQKHHRHVSEDCQHLTVTSASCEGWALQSRKSTF
ncbi:unnamed protein product, partial [Effrenium voratum]